MTRGGATSTSSVYRLLGRMIRRCRACVAAATAAGPLDIGDSDARAGEIDRAVVDIMSGDGGRAGVGPCAPLIL